MLLLDTNVISELVARNPNPTVLSFLTSVAPGTLFTSTICEAEIRFGLARMVVGHRRAELEQRMDQLFAGFQNRIVEFDRRCARTFGDLRAAREKIGRPIGLADAMIAATASVHEAVLVTRNTADFSECGLEVANPWISRR